PTTVVADSCKGRARRPNANYTALASHYAFEALFCMPARGNEKPYAETRVRVLQRQWATPVPRFADLAALNACLRQRCTAEVGRTGAGYEEPIGSRFPRGPGAALPPPARPVAPCRAPPAPGGK